MVLRPLIPRVFARSKALFSFSSHSAAVGGTGAPYEERTGGADHNIAARGPRFHFNRVSSPKMLVIRAAVCEPPTQGLTLFLLRRCHAFEGATVVPLSRRRGCLGSCGSLFASSWRTARQIETV